MSINSQILATMENEGIVNDEGLDFVNATDPVSVKAMSKPGNTQTPLTDDLRQRLLNPLTEVKTISEGIEKVNTMQALHGEINTNPGISFAEAEQVAMTFEGFTKNVSLKEFTKLPSQVNHAFTKRFMDNQIQLKQEQVCTEAELFFNNHLVEQEEALDEYQDFIGKRTIEDLEEFRQKVTEFLSNPQNIKNQYVLEGLGGFNLATISINELSAKENIDGVTEKFTQAFKNIVSIFNNNIHAKPLLECVKDKKGFDDFISPTFTNRSLTSNPSLLDILSMFKDEYLVGLIKVAEAASEASIKALIDIQKEANMNPSDFNQVRDFMVANGETISVYKKQTHYYTEMVELIQDIYLNATAIYEFFLTER